MNNIHILETNCHNPNQPHVIMLMSTCLISVTFLKVNLIQCV